MKDYYVLQHVEVDGDQRVLRITGGEQRRLPVERISAIHLMAGFTLTSGSLELASKHSFPIHVYNYYGVYRGTFFPPPVEPTTSILVNQVRSHLDETRRIEIARTILEHANAAMDALLEPFDIELELKAHGDSIQDLMLSEARLRKEYYALLDTVLPPFWSIVSRGRRPPRRPSDAVLSFANGILYAKTSGWIHRAGLDPRVGYLHGEARARNPLALDLAEVLKAPLSESVLLDVAASGAERSLVTSVNEGVYLNEAGRKAVIQFIEDTLQRSARPLASDREDKLEMWAASVPRKLHRALVTEDVPRFPVIPCTLSSSTMRSLSSGRTSVPS